jgi:hypothetical protein
MQLSAVRISLSEHTSRVSEVLDESGDFLDFQRTGLAKGHAEGRSEVNVGSRDGVGVNLLRNLTSAVSKLSDDKGTLWGVER